MKEFFRFTKGKILLTLLVPFYFGIVTEISNNEGMREAVTRLNVVMVPFIVLLLWAIFYWASGPEVAYQFADLSVFQMILYFILEIIVPLLLNYIIACIIVYLYHKIRSKKKQSKTGAPESSSMPSA